MNLHSGPILSASVLDLAPAEFKCLGLHETEEYGGPRRSTDGEFFATVYHKLVHLPVLETMSQAEHLHSLPVNEMTSQCDNKLCCHNREAKIDSQIDSMQEIERQEYWEWLDLMSGNHWSFHKALYSQEFSMRICVFITYHSNA
ncbi:hypothetical protein ONE63_010806 [Megalurothrips usitatus]|uniref:Uncharacterized protein n=1 Tax=Megalurothrips usitatus TaxID=439358 RepID=A0AAV7XIA5_9NEOP|nr:hypothetical protein ONE63_010806 [Megalurothrips usitatus]